MFTYLIGVRNEPETGGNDSVVQDSTVGSLNHAEFGFFALSSIARVVDWSVMVFDASPHSFISGRVPQTT